MVGVMTHDTAMLEAERLMNTEDVGRLADAYDGLNDMAALFDRALAVVDGLDEADRLVLDEAVANLVAFGASGFATASMLAHAGMRAIRGAAALPTVPRRA